MVLLHDVLAVCLFPLVTIPGIICLWHASYIEESLFFLVFEIELKQGCSDLTKICNSYLSLSGPALPLIVTPACL